MPCYIEFGGGGGGDGGEEGGGGERIGFLLECLRICLCITFSSKLLNGVGCIGLFIGPSPPDYITLDPTLGSFILLEPISH